MKSVAVLFPALIAVAASAAFAQSIDEIRLDGEFDDWRAADVVASDPVGDATGGFDFSRVSARVHGPKVYVRFDSQRPLNLQSGLASDGTLRLRVNLTGSRRLVVDFRSRQAELVTAGSTRTLSWQEIQFACLPTHAATDFELRLDLARLGVRAGDEIKLSFDGSDQLSKPITLTVGREDSRPADPRDLGKQPGTIRIATLNTLRQGSASPQQAPEIRKLFTFADADIYCVNEAFEEDTFRECCFDVVENVDADPKNIHWAQTCGIISRFPLTPLPFKCRDAAALIDVPGDRHLVVASVHFQCCGFAGSDEDLRRISEVTELLSDLKRMREGHFGEKAATAGVVVLGDFNLVGSRKPLDMLNEAGLADVMLRCPVDGSAMTWRGLTPTESFWPGRLDYVTVDEQRVKPAGGFILNSEQLSELDRNFASESAASDHSMLVVDVKLP
jgi:hypothetical protein